MASLKASQGLLAPDVLLSERAAASNDYDLMQEVVDFVNWALRDARLVFAELGELAQGMYVTDQYIAQVMNGGHAQYVHNVACTNKELGSLDRNMALIERTLAQAAEHEYLNIFRDFKGLLEANAGITEKRYRDPRDTPHFKDMEVLNNRFFALDTKKLDAARGQLLRKSPSFRVLSDEALKAEKAKIIANNILFKERGRERQEALDKTPMYFAPRQLCQMVGLEFKFITAGQPTAKPDEIFWGVMTSDGIRMMLLGSNFAELFDKSRNERLARIEF